MINKLIFVLKNDQKDDDAHKAYCESEIKKERSGEEGVEEAHREDREGYRAHERANRRAGRRYRAYRREDQINEEGTEGDLGHQDRRDQGIQLRGRAEQGGDEDSCHGQRGNRQILPGERLGPDAYGHLRSSCPLACSFSSRLRRRSTKHSSDEDESMKTYQETRQKMIDEMDTDQELSNTKSHEMAVLEKKMSFAEEDLQQAHSDKDDVEKVLESLAEECEWVKTHYEKRKEKRDTEIEGLKEAKMILMGAGVKMG